MFMVVFFLYFEFNTIGKKMARANSGSTRTLSMTPPVLTGQSRTDAELWRLSFVLAEIAEQVIQSNSNGGTSTKKQIRQRMNKKNSPSSHPYLTPRTCPYPRRGAGPGQQS